MEIIPKKNIANFSLPLPIYQTIQIADAISKDGENFSIFVGFDKKLVEQLKKYSMDENDVDLQKYTKDKKRFVENSYEAWYKKNRTPFALVHMKTGIMAAHVRFGPEPLHEGCKCHTAGWRSYKPWRGKGLMKDFTKFAMDIYMQKFPNIKLWISAKKENAGSVKLATVLGFKIDKQKSNEKTIAEKKETLVMLK